jgi:hypothetical protein
VAVKRVLLADFELAIFSDRFDNEAQVVVLSVAFCPHIYTSKIRAPVHPSAGHFPAKFCPRYIQFNHRTHLGILEDLPFEFVIVLTSFRL